VELGPQAATARAQTGQERTLVVDGLERGLVIYPNREPAPPEGAPLVLVFHGHGSNVRQAALGYRIHERWPGAVVVYLQGLPTTGVILDSEGRLPGWQSNPGDEGDRDLHFVDATLALVQSEFAIDPERIYAFGHSHGARFVNVLWNMRGETFAAFASAAAQGGLLVRGAPPRSLFMVIGENDPIVPYRTQIPTIPLARQTLQADESQATTQGYLRLEPGVQGTELAMYVHPGGHEIPPEALGLIVELFQRHPRPAW
jgi:polyhydroxybutyrate depolymerase